MMRTPEEMLLRRLRRLPDAEAHAGLIAELEAMDERMKALRGDAYWELPPETRQALGEERTRLTVKARDLLLPGFTLSKAAGKDLGPYVQPTRYEVSVFPESSRDRRHFLISVEWRGGDRWAVLDGPDCLGADGSWGYEPLPSSRTKEWVDSHRFDLETALRLAREAAPLLEVNGRTAWDAVQMLALEAEGLGEV